MAGLQIEIPPAVEPITVDQAKNFLKIDFDDDDNLIAALIQAAREHVEAFTARSLVNKGYIQTLDSFPYYVDSIMSQMAYPPSYYSLPRYSTTLWNYSQMIKLFVSPLVSITNIAYLSAQDQQWHSLLSAPPPWHPNTKVQNGQQYMDGNGNIIIAQNDGVTGFNPPVWNTALNGTTVDNPGTNQIVWLNDGPSPLDELAAGGDAANTYFFDTVSEPPRIFPGPAGSFWPTVMYVPNAVEVHYVAGYGYGTGDDPTNLQPPAAIPSRLITAMFQLVGNWYENREAASPLALREIPNHVKALLWSSRVLDMQPTRG